MDHKLEHQSELVGVTRNLDIHWYCVSEQQQHRGTPSESDEQGNHINIKLLATLKRAELCTKLRKMDFREFDTKNYWPAETSYKGAFE